MVDKLLYGDWVVTGGNYGDQEFLGQYWRGKIKELPREYNCLRKHQRKRTDCRILHFNGVPKPWEGQGPDWWQKYI